MHIKKFNENIINTVMHILGKAKNDIKAWMNMVAVCSRHELQLSRRGSTDRLYMPKAKFALSLDQRTFVCQWLQEIHVPNAYCSNVEN